MVLLAAFAALQTGAAEAFIAECSESVLGVKEGVWALESKNGEGKLYRAEIVWKGAQHRIRQSLDGDPLLDGLVGPTSSLMVFPMDRRYSQNFYSAGEPAAKPPAKTLEPGEVTFNLSDSDGFVLRANPAFSDAVIQRSGERETLEALSKKPDGRVSRFTLVRDTKTKLPVELVVVTLEETTRMRFAIEARSVADSELAIDPSSYKDFQPLDPKKRECEARLLFRTAFGNRRLCPPL